MRSVFFGIFQPIFFQYYEMSYGLNVEMHKQVKQNRPMGIFLRLEVLTKQQRGATKNKHGPDMSDL